MANQFFFVSLVTLIMVLFFTSLHVESRNGEFLFASLDRSNHMIESHEKSGSLSETPAPTPAPVAGGESNNIEFAPVPAAPESGNVFAPSPTESGNGFFGFAPVPAPAALAPSRGDDIETAPTPSVSGIGDAAPVPAPESFESDNPYGLYGQDNEEFKDEKLPEYNNNGYGDNNYNSNDDNGYSSSSSRTDNYYYNNNNNKNNYGYSNRAYNSRGYSNTNYKNRGSNYNNGYENEKQGMSDTRFLDNGRYYYNPNQKSYNQNDGRYESVRESSNEEGYYGKLSNSDLNSMEEYERQHGYSP